MWVTPNAATVRSISSEAGAAPNWVPSFGLPFPTAEALGVAGTQPDDLLDSLTANDQYLRKLLLSITPPWRAN
jgi:hypothetical protein